MSTDDTEKDEINESHDFAEIGIGGTQYNVSGTPTNFYPHSYAPTVLKYIPAISIKALEKQFFFIYKDKMKLVSKEELLRALGFKEEKEDK